MSKWFLGGSSLAVVLVVAIALGAGNQFFGRFQLGGNGGGVGGGARGIDASDNTNPLGQGTMQGQTIDPDAFDSYVNDIKLAAGDAFIAEVCFENTSGISATSYGNMNLQFIIDGDSSTFTFNMTNGCKEIQSYAVSPYGESSHGSLDEITVAARINPNGLYGEEHLLNNFKSETFAW